MLKILVISTVPEHSLGPKGAFHNTTQCPCYVKLLACLMLYIPNLKYTVEVILPQNKDFGLKQYTYIPCSDQGKLSLTPVSKKLQNVILACPLNFYF